MAIGVALSLKPSKTVKKSRLSERNAALTELDLGGNVISDDGAVSLASAVSSNDRKVNFNFNLVVVLNVIFLI